MNTCCICNVAIEGENPPVLAIGHYGHPRYLCTRCSDLLDTVTLGHEPEAIRAAMDELSSTLLRIGTEDTVVNETIEEIFTAAGERAEKIAQGTYDFSEDEVEAPTDEESEDKSAEFEIPEDLRESEEDAELDRKEAEDEKKFDKVLNVIWYILGPVLVGLMIYFFFFR